MIIAKQNISSLSIKYKPGDQVAGLPADEEQRLLQLGVVQYVQDTAKGEEGKPNIERQEVAWFREVMENTIAKEKIEYAERAEIDIGKSKTNKDLIEILAADAVANGVDVQAFSETQLFSFAEIMGIETADKDSNTIITEIEAGFENV